MSGGGMGLPGKVTDTALFLPAGLSRPEIAGVLHLVGRIGRASPWWAADTLVYAEEHLTESEFSQVVEELGWAPQTALNALWIARSVRPDRRRDWPLTFAHHAEVAALEPEDQDYWLGRALEGDRLPNGERKRWNVGRLRQALRALSPGRRSVEDNGQPAAIPPGLPRLALGVEVYVEGVGRCRVAEVSPGPEWVTVELAREKEVGQGP